MIRLLQLFLLASFRQWRAYFRYVGPLREVFKLAITLHGEQKRKYTFEPYWFHLDNVAGRLVKEGEENINIIAAALLHDSLEDVAGLTSQELRSRLAFISSWYPLWDFDCDHICSLVEELTDQYTKVNYPNLNRASRKELEGERLRKISPQAMLIKASDIIDNSESIRKYSPDFFVVYCKEYQSILPMLEPSSLYLRKQLLSSFQ